MKKRVRIMIAALALTIAFCGFATIAYGRDIGSFSNIALGAQGSGVDTFTGQVNRVKVYNYNSSYPYTYAVINVRTSGGGFVYRTGTTTAASIWWRVLNSNGTVASSWKKINHNDRNSVGYLSGQGYGGLSYKLFLDNDNSYAVTTSGSWCPDEGDN